MSSNPPSRFHISREEQNSIQTLLLRQKRRPLSFSDLIFDDYSSYWQEILALLHSRFGINGKGKGETIAIIDSGHTELLNAANTIPGRNYTEQVAHIQAAFDRVEKSGATLP